MSPTLRAVRAVVLFAGSHVLGVLLLAVLVVLDWAAFRWMWTPIAVLVLLRTSLPAFVIVRGMYAPHVPRDEDVQVWRVDDTRQPRLWATVRDLAERLGTRAPDEIVLTADTHVSAVEDIGFLGLAGGRRRLLVGLPLLVGMSEAGLRSVLAHEMSRYAVSGPRLAAVTARGRDRADHAAAHFRRWADRAVAKERARQEGKAARARARGGKARAVDVGGAGVPLRNLAALYRWYARFCDRVHTSAADREEFAADVAAAGVAGRDVTASALRDMQILTETHNDYLETYATIGVKAGMLPLPGQFFGGLRHVLDARREELDELRACLPSEPSAPYAHPKLTERMARVEALPGDGRAPDPGTPALGLLVDAEHTLAAAEERLLEPSMRLLRRLDWPDLVHESTAAQEGYWTRKHGAVVAEVTGGDGSVTDALDAIDAGSQWRITDRLPESAEARAATGRAAREFARPRLRSGLGQLAEAEYVRQGRARWRQSWTDGETSLELPPGHEDLLPAALDAAVADVPDTVPLRELLTP
ncbi:peptidase [Streptomyces sp. NPDC014734]|uniref:peptidase n=1 Tax=Streptomyces sp. NPDC014734 TaxID=3364886 RepID=UPI0036F5B5EC